MYTSRLKLTQRNKRVQPTGCILHRNVENFCQRSDAHRLRHTNSTTLKRRKAEEEKKNIKRERQERKNENLFVLKFFCNSNFRNFIEQFRLSQYLFLGISFNFSYFLRCKTHMDLSPPSALSSSLIHALSEFHLKSKAYRC